jgi:LPS-assembly lipoprotein
MSLADRMAGRLLVGILLLATAVASGCTVRPLYSTQALTGTDKTATSAISSQLAAVSVKEVDTRYAQQVRNQLLFLFYGGAGQPAAPRYVLELGVTELNEWTATTQVNTDNRPTAALMTLTSTYLLTDAETGQVISSGKRQISSSYDVPTQEFASTRAQRNAEDRAARELAELLRLAVAQDLSVRR